MRFREGSAEFGIDLFEGVLAGLELAEIEQPDDASLAAVQLPEWARSEVTYDPDFQGGTLALLDRSSAQIFVHQAMS
jgi:CYTH domain-containing protein